MMITDGWDGYIQASDERDIYSISKKVCVLCQEVLRRA